MRCFRYKANQFLPPLPSVRLVAALNENDGGRNAYPADAEVRSGRPLGRRNRRSRCKGWSAMKALNRIRIRHLALLILTLVSIVFLLTMESPATALARVRPPAEMGDPDGTGDQGSVPSPSISKGFAVETTPINSAWAREIFPMRNFAISPRFAMLLPHLLWRYIWLW
jgi:hypothetical protein